MLVFLTSCIFLLQTLLLEALKGNRCDYVRVLLDQDVDIEKLNFAELYEQVSWKFFFLHIHYCITLYLFKSSLRTGLWDKVFLTKGCCMWWEPSLKTAYWYNHCINYKNSLYIFKKYVYSGFTVTCFLTRFSREV